MSDSCRTDPPNASVSEASDPSESHTSMGLSIELPESGGVTRLGYKGFEDGVTGAVSSDMMDASWENGVYLKRQEIKPQEPALEKQRKYMHPAVPHNSISMSPRLQLSQSTKTPDRAVKRPRTRQPPCIAQPRCLWLPRHSITRPRDPFQASMSFSVVETASERKPLSEAAVVQTHVWSSAARAFAGNENQPLAPWHYCMYTASCFHFYRGWFFFCP